ncbi:hypothetical protein ACLBYD_30000, partial [Rhodococcus sp. C26F]
SVATSSGATSTPRINSYGRSSTGQTLRDAALVPGTESRPAAKFTFQLSVYPSIGFISTVFR